MASVLQGLVWKTCLVFLDDIIVYSQDFQGHLQILKTVFDRLRQANLWLKPKKCEFGKERIRVLGHYVSSEGIEPLPETCQAVKDFPTPTNLRECRSLLGLAGYYRRFILNYAQKCKPLTDVTKKDTVFHLNQDCEAAFQHLKDAPTNPPILA